MATAVLTSALPQNGQEVRRCRVTIPTATKLSKQSFQTELVLKEFSLSFSEEDGTPFKILLEDLVGVTVLPNPPDSNRNLETCRLIVNEFPPVKIQEGKSSRQIKVVIIDFDEEESFEENHRVALKWKEVMLVECDRAVRKTFVTAEECRGGILSSISL